MLGGSKATPTLILSPYEELHACPVGTCVPSLLVRSMVVTKFFWRILLVVSAQVVQEVDILVEFIDSLDLMTPGAVPDEVVGVEVEWVIRELAHSLTNLEPEARRVTNEPRDLEVVLTVFLDQSCVVIHIVRVVVPLDLLSERTVTPKSGSHVLHPHEQLSALLGMPSNLRQQSSDLARFRSFQACIRIPLASTHLQLVPRALAMPLVREALLV